MIDVPHETAAIQRGLQKALKDVRFRAQLAHVTNPWGDGHAAERIVRILGTMKTGR